MPATLKRTIRATEEELMDGTTGACLACGAYADGVEPDARNYRCGDCGQLQVFGLEELLMMGRLELADGEDDDA
jgi:hypothetical protein